MDRVVADADVTTFLNDRFHALFEAPEPGRPEGTVRFYDGCGCPLTDALRPASAEAFIAVANEVIVLPGWAACEGRPFSRTCAPARADDGADRGGSGL
jgi:hypothetical protein